MLNVGPGGLTPERRHLPCHPVWDRTMPHSFYTATPLCLGDTLSMEPSNGQFILETRGGALDRAVHEGGPPLHPIST